MHGKWNSLVDERSTKRNDEFSGVVLYRDMIFSFYANIRSDESSLLFALCFLDRTSPKPLPSENPWSKYQQSEVLHELLKAPP